MPREVRSSLDLQAPLLLNGSPGAPNQVAVSRGAALSAVWGNRGQRFFYQDAAPAAIDCLPGDEWVKRDDPELPLYKYIDDGTSFQWVNFNGAKFGGGAFSYTLAVDFGNAPVESKQFTITSLPVSATQRVIASPSAVDGDELECDMLCCAAYVTAVDTINLYVNSFPGPVAGVRNLVLFVS
jgi:hypothetical protein